MLFAVMKLGLAGDAMLGRLVAERLSERPPESIFDRELVEIAHEADLFVLNPATTSARCRSVSDS